MKKFFSSLDYQEQLSSSMIMRRSKMNNTFVIYTCENRLKKIDILEYVIFEEDGKKFIFYKTHNGFYLYEITDEDIVLLLSYRYFGNFKRSVTFYIGDISINEKFEISHSDLKINRNNVFSVKNNSKIQYNHFSNGDMEVSWDANSVIKFKGFKICDYDRDPEIFYIS